MKENDIERKLTTEIRKRGGLCFKFTSPNAAGVPDRIVIAPGGRVIFVELKADSGRVTALQSWQISRINKIGGDARVLRGMDQVKTFISEVFTAGGDET